ncbi:hypothetical protein [Planctomyces sp. SH-PL14]|uniref:hypothetical protein n=1 Tax=Planctomyces sp. SH-PL14 TaxID=1632864 RepID=UPI00078B2DDC|nr:hypothetical protein [Planctomyces sp. SH-PL14]AMV17301.1 hypothetical protein VT03_05375 [Planctomyces sp. SH-PL14]
MSSLFVARRPFRMLFAVSACLLTLTPLYGQTLPVQQGEVQAIARLSKQFIEDEAARQEIVAAVPYNAQVQGFNTRGVIDARGKISIEMRDQATFVLQSRGSAWTSPRGVRGPFVASGVAYGPFSSETLIRFDGRQFIPVQTTPWAQVHGELHRIEGRRGRPIGRIIGRLMLPVAQRLVPSAEVQATPIARSYLKNYVDDLSRQIAAKLNRRTPVEKSLNRLFPETREWAFQMSSDPQFLQAAYGPQGSQVPKLPDHPFRLKDVRMELWLRSTATEARDLEKISKLPLAKALVDKYIETQLPELADLGENRSLDAVQSWLVISVGGAKPK